MTSRMKAGLCLAALAASLAPMLPAAEPDFNAAMTQASADYRGRLEQAGAELTRVRERITAEKAPWLARLRAAEDRIIAAETETTRYETALESAAETRRQLLKDLDALRKNTTYIKTLAHESLKAVRDSLAPGEEALFAEALDDLQTRLDDATAGPNTRAAVDVVESLFAHARQELGGYGAPGQAMLAATNEVVQGTYAFFGPEVFFRPANGGQPGAVRPREGAPLPAMFALPSWKAAPAAAFFRGESGAIAADASGGKALRFRETTGTVWEHIRKGGMVAYAIVVVGVVSLIMCLGKIRDLRAMSVASPEAVRAFLHVVANGTSQEMAEAVSPFKGMTAELFSVGLQYRRASKLTLEEHLQAVLLRQRLHSERRLPLLAVIATASPLMGLLGTVTGMVKTFALITVFGTGNAGKLSSGISEVLVATELGLAVAIPTLVAHGFLSHRIQKNLALLERYALQFVTAADAARNGAPHPVPAATVRT
jgi:biopolymer transport protein ExbB